MPSSEFQWQQQDLYKTEPKQLWVNINVMVGGAKHLASVGQVQKQEFELGTPQANPKLAGSQPTLLSS